MTCYTKQIIYLPPSYLRQSKNVERFGNPEGPFEKNYTINIVQPTNLEYICIL